MESNEVILESCLTQTKQLVAKLTTEHISRLQAGVKYFRKLDDHFIEIDLLSLSMETVLLLIKQNKIYY